MNWDQIERKWALMTRRISADFSDERREATEVALRSLKHPDPLTPKIADSQAFVVMESEFKTSAK